MSTEEAIHLAREQGFDLVEVASATRPPVCRIMDYGKFKYQQKKKAQGSHKKLAGQTLKEVKLRPKTESHDYQVKLKHVNRFLLDGHKVKITVRFRGREMAHKDLGLEMLDRITKDVGDLATIASPAYMEGRMLQMTLAPSPKALVIKRNRDEEREKAREAERLRRKGSGEAKPGEAAPGAKEEEPEEEEEEEDDDLDDDSEEEGDDEDGEEKKGDEPAGA
jgi:translation initiation factor IF-3